MIFCVYDRVSWICAPKCKTSIWGVKGHNYNMKLWNFSRSTFHLSTCGIIHWSEDIWQYYALQCQTHPLEMFRSINCCQFAHLTTNHFWAGYGWPLWSKMLLKISWLSGLIKYAKKPIEIHLTWNLSSRIMLGV